MNSLRRKLAYALVRLAFKLIPRNDEGFKKAIIETTTLPVAPIKKGYE